MNRTLLNTIYSKPMPCGVPLRRVVLYNKAYVFEIIDLGANWFESATVDTNIITYGKRKSDIQQKINSYKISLCDDIIKAKKEKLSGDEKKCFIYPKKDNSSWIILNEDERSILDKILKFKPLKDWDITINYGIKTGFNEAFIIDEATKERLIKEDSKSAEIIKPLLRGRDIKRYCYDYNDLYLLFIPWHFPLNKDDTIIGASLKAEEEFKNNYKAVYNHLLNFKEQLLQRNKAETGIRYEWYALQRCAASYYEEFYKPKIIYQEICQEASYALDESKSFINNTGYIMTSEKYNLKVLLSLLNSKLYWWFFKNNNVILGDSAIRMLGMYIEILPIIEVNEKIEKDIIQLVDKIILAKKDNKDSSALEEEINKIVYSLYELTDDEIKIIEGE